MNQIKLENCKQMLRLGISALDLKKTYKYNILTKAITEVSKEQHKDDKLLKEFLKRGRQYE